MSESRIGSSNGSATGGIIPFQRIEELEYFYTSDSVKNDKVIEVVDVKDKKKFSEEVQGQWALEQIEAVLDILRVRLFVIPKDKGGYEIPTIASREEYMAAHTEAKSKTLDHLVSTQDSREIYIQVLKSKMEKAKNRRETTIIEIQNERNSRNREKEDSEDEEEQNESVQKIIEDEKNFEEIQDDVNDDFAKAYSKWNKEQQAQNDDMMKYESILEICRKEASRQHDEDADATNRLRSALFVLKKFIQGLMKKFPFLEDIVRQKRDDGIDPYDENDMRSSYVNLLNRFRQSDEMGILTTIMSGMAEKQGNKSMSAFMLCVEDWHQTMIRLGVQSISMSDLAAIITLKGMNESHRIEFLQQENALELTLETLDQDEEEYEDSEEGSTMTAKKEKKSLLVRVKKFIQKDKTNKLINQRLSGGSGITTNISNSSSRKDAEERLKEAQNVFITSLVNNGICRSFASTGKCKFGSKCNYKHEETILTKNGSGQAKDEEKRECFAWRDTGTCKFGDKCRFKHSSKNQSAKEHVTAVKETHNIVKKDNIAKDKSQINSKLFSVDDEGPSWGNEGDRENVTCVMTTSSMDEDAASDEKVLSVKNSNSYSSNKLGWDSMASIHVAKNKDDLGSIAKLRTPRSASGMGGILPITHQGYNSQFRLQMHVIEGGQTPNIKSVGQALKTDVDGTEFVAIFTAKGATQMSLTRESKRQIMDILTDAERDQRIIGTAVQRNGIYEEDFGSGLESEPSEDEKAFAVTSMYTHRVPMSSADDIIGMLVSACVKEEHLIAGIRQQSIKGLPECVNEDAVKQYFKLHGKDEDIIMAEVANAPLKTPIDYEKEVYHTPGEHLQLDNVDPSFARVKGEKAPVISIGGYRDAVVAIDNCGYSMVIGRERKKNPHLIVQQFLEKWIGRWQSLRKISADKEFITVDTMSMCRKKDIQVCQAVPNDHRRGLGASEGLNRWLQDAAQAHMNRLTAYVKAGVISEHEKRSLWFHALSYANDVKLLGPSKLDPKKTQWEEGEGVKFNFSKYVILPFGLRVVVRKPVGDQDGRGLDGIYVGFSKVVAGGILVYMLNTKRVTQKYTFVPREPMPTLSDVDIKYAATSLYGDIHILKKDEDKVETAPEDCPQSSVGGDISNLSSINEGTDIKSLAHDIKAVPSIKVASSAVGGAQKTVEKRVHFTRSKKKDDFVLVVTSDRPQKPKLPTRSEARKSLRWKAAFKREIKKINEEDTLGALPRDPQHRFIRPENAVVMRLLAVLEWKWKPDPDTGVECWLECVRIVCDGSSDTRVGEVTYAETPDRTLLFLMASIEATLRMRSKTGDAIRAYLNAPSLDTNLVVIADKDMTEGTGDERFERESLLLKGLYGSIKGALSFQVWVEQKLQEISYQKCSIARGVYMKELAQGNIVRLLRHSDDFLLSANNAATVDEEVKLLREQIRTTPFKDVDEFLGCQFKRYRSEDMVEDVVGDIILVTMVGKIEKLNDDYGYLKKRFNPTGRVRYTPLPLKPIPDEDDLAPEQKVLLSPVDIKLFMSLTMSIGWIVGNVRPNLKFPHHVIAKKLATPRVWDMYLAVWLMEHIILTKEWPLILGGPTIDPEVEADSSFGTMEERKTVGSHCLVTARKSGVIYANVHTYKVTVKSIFNGEALAASEGQDTSIYARRVVEELKYPSKDSRKVLVDNSAAIDWMLGSVPTKRSKHMEIRLYRSRHLVDEGEIMMEYIPTEENMADLLTKSLPRARYEKLAKRMLGHELVKSELQFWH